jgi:hypothetical protein
VDIASKIEEKSTEKTARTVRKRIAFKPVVFGSLKLTVKNSLQENTRAKELEFYAEPVRALTIRWMPRYESSEQFFLSFFLIKSEHTQNRFSNAWHQQEKKQYD